MSIRTFLALAALGAAPVLAIACVKKESVDSRDVTTHGMSLEFEVKNDGSASKVNAKLHVGSYQTYTYARLIDGEQLILTDPSMDKRVLSFAGTNDAPEYVAEVNTSGGTYLLDFLRVKGAASALGNKLELPPAFTLKAPTAAPRNQPLTFTWDAAVDSGATMSYTLSGDCIQAHVPKNIIGDPGTFTINAGEIKAFSGKENATCRLKLTVVRAKTTNACCSAEFGHESIARGIQERVISFDSTP
jgi:hypothetical protein